MSQTAADTLAFVQYDYVDINNFLEIDDSPEKSCAPSENAFVADVALVSEAPEEDPELFDDNPPDVYSSDKARRVPIPEKDVAEAPVEKPELFDENPPNSILIFGNDAAVAIETPDEDADNQSSVYISNKARRTPIDPESRPRSAMDEEYLYIKPEPELIEDIPMHTVTELGTDQVAEETFCLSSGPNGDQGVEELSSGPDVTLRLSGEVADVDNGPDVHIGDSGIKTRLRRVDKPAVAKTVRSKKARKTGVRFSSPMEVSRTQQVVNKARVLNRKYKKRVSRLGSSHCVAPLFKKKSKTESNLYLVAKVFHYAEIMSGITEETKELLIEAAHKATKRAYCPYSNYPVGAALYTEDGHIVTGGNVENASYGGTICAERSAIVSAIAQGHKRFQAIAIATQGPTPGSPCGICRQFMFEFGDFPIFLVTSQNDTCTTTSVKELLPGGFGPHSLDEFHRSC